MKWECDENTPIDMHFLVVSVFTIASSVIRIQEEVPMEVCAPLTKGLFVSKPIRSICLFVVYHQLT